MTICLNRGSDTRVLSGSSIFCIICYHSYYGPYQHRLPYWVEALLTYNHNFLFVDVGGVVTGTVGTSGFLVIVIYCYFVRAIVLVVGSIVCCSIGYWWVVVCFFNVCSCFY